jgi:hypothetical protein
MMGCPTLINEFYGWGKLGVQGVWNSRTLHVLLGNRCIHMYLLVLFNSTPLEFPFAIESSILAVAPHSKLDCCP